MNSELKAVETDLIQRRNPLLADELARFGQMMISEVLDRSQHLDQKALSVVGWGSAVLAFLTVSSHRTGASEIQEVLLMFGGTFALAAVVFGGLGLRVRGWPWPSRQDWLRQDEFDDVYRLSIFHLLQTVDTREGHAAINEKKGKWLQRAQTSIALSGLFVGLSLVVTYVWPLAVAFCPLLRKNVFWQ